MERAETIFEQVLDLAMAERAAFLERECAGVSGLRERVQKLVEAHERAERLEFLSSNLTQVSAEGLGDRIDRYKLLEKIGEGGCGVVYVAEQTEPVRRRVALKVIKLGMDTKQVVARFEAERQALAMMDHPNIAKVFDAGTTGDDRGADFSPQGHAQAEAPLAGKSTPSDPEVRRTEVRAPTLATPSGRPFFVMELVRGIRITDYCELNNLSTKQRLDLFIKVCQAIQHAHQKGIIHRDIKPSNILVTLHDGVPVPKVIDFGIAKATEGRLTDGTVYTQLHQFIGTPAYMSPEQAEMSGLDIDTRSDIYSLGVLLYELLTGKTPFDAKDLMDSGIDAMRKTIREKEPARPSTRLTQQLVFGVPPLGGGAWARPTGTLETKARPPEGGTPSGGTRSPHAIKELINLLRGDLDWIVMKCLEKDRSRRYDTANGLAADLNRHLNDEPIIARPPSATYKLQKAWRRNKVAFTAATAVAIALIVGISVSTWQAFEASRARDAAQSERDNARTEQTKAEKARLEANAEVYVANMNLAGPAWQQGNYVRLRLLLAATRDSPDRGFEWYYWQRQAHLNLTTLRGHLDRVNAVGFSWDGRRIVTGSGDQTARVWDATSGQELFKLLGHKSGITSAAFSSDGQRIVTGSQDQTAIVWDATSQRELFKLMGHGAGVSCVGFSANGQRIVTSSVDGTARVWDATTGRELRKIQGHTNSVYSAAFSPDGQRIITGSADETAKVWDAATGRELLKISDIGPISSVAFSPDGKRILTGNWISTASVWDAVKGDKLLSIRGHAEAVLSVAFSPDGRCIVTGGGDGTTKVWDASGDREPLLLRGNSPDLLTVAISPDGRRIATGGGTFDDTGTATGTKQAAQVWEMASGEKLFTLEGHSSGLSSLAFSSNGLWIVSGSGDHTARVWDAANGRPVRTLEGHNGAIYSVAFSPDSQRIVTGGLDRTARVWEAATGRQLLDLEGHTAPVRSVAFSPEGQWIVTGGDDFSVRVWDAANGQQVRRLQSTNIRNILSVAFSPDGQRVAAGGWNAATVWEQATRRELFTLMGHIGPVCAVVFSPDGQRIVTGSYDSTAKLWDAHTGRELLTFECERDVISSVAFSPDGQRIVTGHISPGDGTARVWEAAKADQVAAWEDEERTAAESHDRWQKELAAQLRKHADEEKRQ